jgi:hypothetical protein
MVLDLGLYLYLGSGTHGMTIIGYDEENFFVKNSWGENNSYPKINMINGKLPFDVITSPENPYNQFIREISFIIRKEDFYEIAKNFQLLLTVWQVNYLHGSNYDKQNIWTNLIRPREKVIETHLDEERKSSKLFRRTRKRASLLFDRHHVLESILDPIRKGLDPIRKGLDPIRKGLDPIRKGLDPIRKGGFRKRKIKGKLTKRKR